MHSRSVSWLFLLTILLSSICYANTPQVTSTSPASGPIGTSVQVYGSGFGATQGTSTISFNGVNATVTSWADGQITATVPSAATGPVQVTVGGIGSNANVYFSVPPPQVTSISPTSGVVGTTVTISGSGFGLSQGSSCVAFGSVCATSVSNWNATQIVAAVPNGTSTGAVWVKVNNASSNLDVLFTTPNPTVTSVSPTSGTVGTQVQVNGSGFGSTQGSNTISFNNQTASVVSWSDTQITAAVPSSATTGPVQVKIATFGSNTNIDFVVPPPQVTTISPTRGVVGNQVTITGSGFQGSQGSSTVSFNGHSAAVSNWNNTQIIATVPSGTTTGPVKVTVNSVASNQDVVFATVNPVITSLSPAVGPGGTQVQVNGVGFGATQGSSSITIAGYPPTVVSWSDTQIVANTVSYALTGSATVTVSGVNSNADNIFTVPPPQITSVSPTTGVVGTQVTITGTNFPATSTSSRLLFNGVSANTSSWNGTQIVATVPSSATTGPVTILVNGSLNSNENIMFTLPNPVISVLSPTSGPVGTQVQINGSGFGTTQGSSTISFSGNAATVSSWSDGQIVATVPATATSGPVTVWEGGVTSNNGVSFNVPGPQVTGISPSSGGVGTQVTITGSNFQSTRPTSGFVYLNGTQASIVNWNNTQIAATISSSMTTGGVKVSVNGVNSNQDFIFTVPSPAVSGFAPNGGPVGTSVQVNGSGFGSTQGSSTIAFNGTNATNVTWSDTQIIASVPSGATTGVVKVTVGGIAGSSTSNFNVGTVDVNSVSPSAGPTGTQVTVSGVGFGGSPGTLSFNGTNATSMSSWTDSQIIATVPSGTTTGAVKVVNGGVSSNTTVNFTVSGVVVTGVSPSTAPVGTQIQINGSGFGNTQGSSSVSINNYSASVANWSSTQITVAVPNVVTTGPVKVTVGSASSNTDFNVAIAGPTITSISPTSGPVGTQVTINGSHFGTAQGSSTISFNGTNGTNVTWSDTQIQATVPHVTSGPVKVTVSFVSSNTNINYTVPTPQISSISPASGAVGTQVTIYGSGFTSGQGTVIFSYPSASASIVSWTDTQIVCTVPSAAQTGGVYVAYGSVTSNQDVVFAVPSPIVTGLSPSTGPVTTQVTINGQGFGATQGSSSVAFNGSNASIVTWSDGQIVAAVPTSATTGPVKVTVGGFGSNVDFDFGVPAPQVINVSPASGAVGTQVTISGSGFQSAKGSSSININGATATVNSWTDSQIVATVGTGTTTGAVKVTVNQVPSNQNVQFIVPSPIVNGLSPSSGPVATQVQVNGVGFGASQGSSTITFDGYTATVNSWSDTQIVATVPSTAATGVVVVTNGGVTSNSNIVFTVPAPQVTSISPTSGAVGTQVTINGSGFQATQGNPQSDYVTFNGRQATIVSWSNTQIVATVPANSGTGPVAVQLTSGTSNQNVIFAMPNPVITGVVPSMGTFGTQVQINGTGFGATQGSSTLTFSTPNSTSGAPAITSWSDTQIVATLPIVATSGPVTISEGGIGSNNNVNFTVPPPQLTSITPNIGGSGNSVTVVGSGFQGSQSNLAGTSQVQFSGTNAPVTTWSDSQIAGAVPAGASTGPVRVVVNGQYSNLVNYTIPANSVSSVSPTSGPVGSQVTVTGSGFGATQGTSALTFNGQLPATITSWSNTQIVATVPVTATTGPAAVTVNNVPSNINVIYSVPPPAITSMSPGGGVPGTSITINGSGFQANQRNSTVTFNGVSALSITSWSDTQIVASVPSGASTGPLQVNVNSTSNGTSNNFVVPNVTIASLSPPSGPLGGMVVVNGSGFGATQGTIANVSFNGALAPIYSWSDTQIVVQVPGGATNGPVVVNQYDGVSNAVQFTVEGQATVTSVSPAVGPVGSSVTVTGTGFGNSQSNSTVNFNGVPGTVTNWSDTQISATVPPGATTGPISVNVAAMYGGTVDYILDTTVHLTDSLGNNSTYNAQMLGGQWVSAISTGSGCSSCTMRGTVTNILDSNGNLLAHFDELGHVTNYTYDGNNNVTSQSQWLNSSTTATTSYTYNSFGEPVTLTDPLGNVTTNTYDGNGNLLTVTTPAPNSSTAASVTQFAYDSKGEITQITDPLGNISTLTYNPVGLIATIKDTQNNVISYGYDQRGNRTSVTDALNNQTAFQYDAGDRLTKITYPDQSTVSFGYDYRGRRTSITDQNGKVTTYSYDDADRLTSVTDAANNVTQYTYDTENNLLSITDAAGHTTSFTYDAFGRVTQTSFPSTLVENYIYDAVGNLTTKTDRNGNSILYVYDALNRLIHKGYPDSTGVDYVYDLAGKIRQVTDPTGTYAMAYDNMGRLIGTTTTYSFLPSMPFTNTYAYDANSNRTSLTLPDGSSDTYQYDTLNRLSRITDSLTGVFNFGYDGLSERTSLTRPNGVNTSYGYDSLSRLLVVMHQAAGTTLDGATYAYDPAGNRTTKTNLLNNTAAQYSYDPTYQLTQVLQGTTTTESYSYDSVGNRLSSLAMGSYSYNVSNELTATAAATFSYDSNGNTLSKVNASGTTQYTWDFENRLKSVTLPNGTAIFAYDPFGRRIQKAFTQSSTTTVTNYVYDWANAIEEVDATGNLLGRYVQGVGIDEPLAELRSGTSVFYEADGLGSVTSLSSSAGSILNAYTYDAFGNAAMTGAFVNSYRYTARDFDSETGLQYSRARYYDASTGRFLSEDPLGFQAGDNFYAYVGNSPSNWNDALGLCPSDRLKKFCSKIPAGRMVALSGTEFVGPGGTGSLEAVMNYDTGQISLFLSGGFGAGWSGGGDGSFSTGLIFGDLKGDNSGYSGGFANMAASGGLATLGLGAFHSSSNGDIFGSPKNWLPDNRVTVNGVSFGASFLPTPTGGTYVSHYSNPAQLPSWMSKLGVALNPDDWAFMALRKYCRKWGGIK